MVTQASKTTAKTDTLIKAPTKVRVSRSVKLSGEGETSSSTEEVIEITPFVSQPAVAKASIPLKMTMDYQSLGIEIGVELPCYPEELEAGVDKAYAMAFARIQAKIPEIQKTLLEITGRSSK